MKLSRIDDYQSWLVESGDDAVLVDPWLEDEFHLPPGKWFFSRRRVEAPAVPAAALPKPTAIVLTAHFVDHFDDATLAKFDKSTPVHATPMAARFARKLGFTDVRAHGPGESVAFGSDLRGLSVRPAFPYAHNSIGWLFSSEASGTRAYLETHTTDEREVAKLGKVDAVLTTAESVHIGPIQFGMDPGRTARTLRIMSPEFFLPTGVNPAASEGFLGKVLLRCTGTLEEAQEHLAGAGLPTKMVRLAVGDALDLVGKRVERRFT